MFRFRLAPILCVIVSYLFNSGMYCALNHISMQGAQRGLGYIRSTCPRIRYERLCGQVLIGITNFVCREFSIPFSSSMPLNNSIFFSSPFHHFRVPEISRHSEDEISAVGRSAPATEAVDDAEKTVSQSPGNVLQKRCCRRHVSSSSNSIGVG